MVSTTATMDLVGGAPALDFANTAADGAERLNSVDDLLAWAAHAGTADAVTLERCRAELRCDPVAAAGLFVDARGLRDALIRVGAALAAGGHPAPEDLAAVRPLAAATVATSELAPTADGSAYLPRFDHGDVRAALLGPIVWSAVTLLLAGGFERLKQCPSCHFLFFDRSKNNSRRWCDMSVCGNRNKLQSFRRRRAGG